MAGAECPSVARVDGKVAVVTGANGGVGLHIATDLARRGEEELCSMLWLHGYQLLRRECLIVVHTYNKTKKLLQFSHMPAKR